MIITASETGRSSIDFQQYKRLLFQVARLAHISIEIKDPSGSTLLYVSGMPHGVCCSKQGNARGICSTESFNLFQHFKSSVRTFTYSCFAGNELVAIPIFFRKDLVGVLIGCKGVDKGGIEPGIAELLEELAYRISDDIRSGHEIESFAGELSDKYEELNLIYDIGKKLGGISCASEAIYYIIEQAKETLHADMLFASVPSKDIHELASGGVDLFPSYINSKVITERFSSIMISRLSMPAMSSGYVVMNNTADDSQLKKLFDVPVGILAVPVKLKGEITGLLGVINFDLNKSFETSDVRLALSLSQQISLALTNAELYQDLKDFLTSVIKTLAYSIEAKDAYTRGHSERVGQLSMKIAEALDMSYAEKEALSWAAILHDIGKIGIPGSILTKNCRLTDEEFDFIKKHPDKGYRILLPIQQLMDSLNGIRHHHERYDGSGYPLGLKGEEIPLQARIIAVADTYDAMTSDRSYRSKMSHEKAVAEMIRVKGIQLDPDLVDVFINLHRTKQEEELLRCVNRPSQ